MPFCPRCGADDPPHPACLEALSLDPPRFCPSCGARLRVRVEPDGFTALCSQHGLVEP